VRRHCRSRRFCTLPTSCPVMPLGSPTSKVPDLVLDGEGDHPLGRLMLGLVDATAMASFDPPQASQMAPPKS
jgi:hypothetical protein